jgi:hypothetical protein
MRAVRAVVGTLGRALGDWNEYVLRAIPRMACAPVPNVPSHPSDAAILISPRGQVKEFLSMVSVRISKPFHAV